jgi:nucleoside-diphosphate-sugar epimerase
MSEARKILVLGASGLIGRFVTDDLRARGFHVVGLARGFSISQKASALDLERPVLSMGTGALARLMRDHGIDLVVNCLGVLQDGPGSDTRAVHHDFVARLLIDRRHRGVGRLYAGNGDPDAGFVNRAARRAGQDWTGDRLDAGGAADAG